MDPASMRLYSELAGWFHLLTAPEDYEEEARVYSRLFHEYEHEGGHDGDDGRALRYHEKVFDPDPADSVYQVEMTLHLREADGSERVETDDHTYGLFGKSDWVEWLGEAGVRVESIPSALGGDGVPTSYIFVGVKPS